MCGMVSGIVIQIFVVQVLLNVVESQSPCPNFFRYHQDENTKEFMAIVEIPPPPKDVTLYLRITLSIATPLPTKYVGRVELVKTKKESVQDILNGRSLFYRIHFPLQRPIPVLTSIYFNNLLLCEGPPAFGPVTTAILLEHTLYPPRSSLRPTSNSFIPDKNNSNYVVTPQDNQNPSQINNQFTEMPTINNHYEEPDKKSDIQGFENCGKISNFKPLYNDRKLITSPEEWPWLATIYLGFEKQYEFQCVGNLISDKHVITAAHCVKFLIDDPSTHVIMVSFGKLSLVWLQNEQTINIQVIEVIVHPDNTNPLNADSDLAILVLMETVKFSSTIQPICLWPGPTDFERIVGKWGYVVGWGNDDKLRYTEKPTLTKVPIVSQEVCLRSNYTFLEITSNRTFCAGRRDGSGPCNGDSGSGLILFHQGTKRFHLRGIVAFSLIHQTTLSCDLSQYIIYVDVAKYLNWIREQISQTADIDIRRWRNTRHMWR